jgi:hypothetical protein
VGVGPTCGHGAREVRTGITVVESAALSLLIYLGGGALLGALLRWWRPQPGWRWIGAYWLFAGAFFAAPLTTSLLQVPTDIAYVFRPWSAQVPPAFQPANPLLRDVPLQVLPFRALVRERLLDLEAPLWANEMGTGQPLLGNAQSAPFSLFTLLTLPLTPVRGLPVSAALKLFLSLLLTDALLAALGAGRAGAVFAAVAFSFSAFSISWAYHPHGMAMAWVPGVLLALVLLRRGERGGLPGLVVCAAGLALCGHPETLAHTALAAAGVTFALLLQPGGLPRPRFLLRLAAGVVLAACLTAPALLPVAAAVGESARGYVVTSAPQLMQPPDFAWRDLRLLVEPLAFGNPRDGTWAGATNFNEECSGYAGLLALALALAAAVVLRGRALAVLASGAVALAAALGFRPVLRLLTAIPPFDQAMNGRLRLFWVLALAVAAGLGLEPLLARRTRWAAAAAVTAATAALALDRPPGFGLPQEWWIVALTGGCVTVLALLAPELRRRTVAGAAKRPAAEAPTAETAALTATVKPAGGHATLEPGAAAALPWLLVGCLALDLGLLNAGFLPVLPPAFDLSPVPPIPLLMRERAAAPASPWRVMAYDSGLLPNLSALYGLWDARSNDPMHPARASLVVNFGLRPRHWEAHEVVASRPRYPIEFLSYLDVRYLFTPPGEELPPPWQESWSGASGKLWRNPLALPLFFMPAACRRARDAGAALQATVSNPDFTASAVFEGEPPGFAIQQGTVLLRRMSAGTFDLETSTPTGGLVVSSVTFDRGWRLAVDGVAATPVRVNAAFLGLFVSPGSHHVVLTYRPAGWVWGLRLCGLALAVCLLAALHPLLPRRPASVALRSLNGL